MLLFFFQIQGFLARGGGVLGGGHMSVEKLLNFSRMSFFKKNFLWKIQGFLARGGGGPGGGQISVENGYICHVCFFKKSLFIKKIQGFLARVGGVVPGGGGGPWGGGRFQWKMANVFQVFFFQQRCFFKIQDFWLFFTFFNVNGQKHLFKWFFAVF